MMIESPLFPNPTRTAQHLHANSAARATVHKADELAQQRRDVVELVMQQKQDRTLRAPEALALIRRIEDAQEQYGKALQNISDELQKMPSSES